MNLSPLFFSMTNEFIPRKVPAKKYPWDPYQPLGLVGNQRFILTWDTKLSPNGSCASRHKLLFHAHQLVHFCERRVTFFRTWVIELNTKNETNRPVKSGFLVSFSLFNAAFDTKRYWLRPNRIRRIIARRTVALFLIILGHNQCLFFAEDRVEYKSETQRVLVDGLFVSFFVFNFDFSIRTKSGPSEAGNCVHKVHNPIAL